LSRLDDLQTKYDSQKVEVDAGRKSLAALESEAATLADAVTNEANRIRKQRESAQFGRCDYTKADQAKDSAALQSERGRLEALQLDAGKLRRMLREKSTALRQTGGALIQEQRRVASPLLLARRDGLLEDINALLPELGAVLAIVAQEPPELFSAPSRALNTVERQYSDRADYRERVFEYYAAAMAAVGLDSTVEH